MADADWVEGVRFVNGRLRHRVRPPDDHRWWDLLHAACGKQGYKTDAYVFGAVRDCRGCAAAINASTEQEAA
ncbi:hypothetical protein [Streptomyces sp. NPDC101249]|uniref:hypothetical protein n=1 Tax=Streptomyces sp. NPDC101249 TaxID=3366140 RepID=UPI0038182605